MGIKRYMYKINQQQGQGIQHREYSQYFITTISRVWASLVACMVKNPPAMQETWVQSLGWEDPLEKGMATYSCLENPIDRGTWWATIHGVAKSQTQLND